MLKRSANQQTGLSLLELMIALALGLVVLTGVTSVFVSTMVGNFDNLKMTRLNQELRTVMLMVTRDLRRAGYWRYAFETIKASRNTDLSLSSVTPGTGESLTAEDDIFTDLRANGVTGFSLLYVDKATSTPYRLTVTGYTADDVATVTVIGDAGGNDFPDTELQAGRWFIVNPFGDITVDETNDCVFFTYDNDQDGVEGAAENYGFSFDAVNGNVRTGDQAGVTPGASPNECTGGTGSWATLNDGSTVEITAFDIQDRSEDTFVTNGINVTVREYEITLTGRLRGDTKIIRTVSDMIKIRNNDVN